jgi:hypothetical protein
VAFERPPDDAYYEPERIRVPLFSQGDIFRDLPRELPAPADAMLVDEEEGGARAFLRGPLDFGPAMLITPSCSLGAQQAEGYAHPVRTLVPILPLDVLVGGGIVKEGSIPGLLTSDNLLNYMYLPALTIEDEEFEMPESLALLYHPLSLHHAFLEGQRMTQLAFKGAQQLQRKLVWFFSGWKEEDLDFFEPPMD